MSWIPSTSVVAGVAVIVAALIIEQPSQAKFGAAVGTGLALILFGVLVGYREQAAKRRPNYAVWDNRSDFRFSEAACLWIDREPTIPPPRAARKVASHLHA